MPASSPASRAMASGFLQPSGNSEWDPYFFGISHLQSMMLAAASFEMNLKIGNQNPAMGYFIERKPSCYQRLIHLDTRRIADSRRRPYAARFVQLDRRTAPARDRRTDGGLTKRILSESNTPDNFHIVYLPESTMSFGIRQLRLSDAHFQDYCVHLRPVAKSPH
jgi:hypothetical protein